MASAFPAPHLRAGNFRPTSVLEGLKVSWGTAMWILLLTLAVWTYFYVERLPLDAAATAVVALAVTVIVVAAQWLWSRIRRGPQDKNGTAK